jgi:hypothetical protein
MYSCTTRRALAGWCRTRVLGASVGPASNPSVPSKLASAIPPRPPPKFHRNSRREANEDSDRDPQHFDICCSLSVDKYKGTNRGRESSTRWANAGVGTLGHTRDMWTLATPDPIRVAAPAGSGVVAVLDQETNPVALLIANVLRVEDSRPRLARSLNQQTQTHSYSISADRRSPGRGDRHIAR